MAYRSEFAGALSVIGLLVAAVTAITYLTRMPAAGGYFGSLLPHLSLVLCVVGVCLALVGAPLRSTLALAAGFLGLAGVAYSVIDGAALPRPVRRPTASVDVTSFNILGDNIANGMRIAQAIAQSPSDVFIVMEGGPIQPYLDQIARSFPYRVGCEVGKRCDLVVFSRLPIESSDVHSAGATFPNRVDRLSLQKSGVQFTVVASHITKPFLENWGMDELRWLADFLNNQTGPIIDAGDFNQASWSPMLQDFLHATSLKTGPIEAATWPPELGNFGIPIDHVFARGGAQVEMVEALPDAMGSNHRGLHAVVSLQ